MSKARPDENQQFMEQGSSYDPEENMVPYEAAPKKPKPATPDSVPINLEIVTMDTVTPESVDWLWEHRIARGKFNLIDGDPGEGKSLLTLDLAARLSTGQLMPEQQTATYGPSKVLFLLCEDDLGDTVAPRLIAAGADRKNIVVIRTLLQIPRDLGVIEGQIKEVGASMLIIDPLNAYIEGKVSTHNDHEVRSALTPLVQLAARVNVAVVGVRHLNKQTGGSAKYRGGGSIAFIGLARSGLMVGIDPEDPDKRILASSKGNLSRKPSSLRFRIVENADKQPFIEWLGLCDVTADQLCAPPESEETRSALADAKEFLQEQLADGAKSADELYKLADVHKIAQRTLRRARGALHIPKGKIWELPAGKAPGRPDVKAIG